MLGLLKYKQNSSHKRAIDCTYNTYSIRNWISLMTRSMNTFI